MTSFERGETVEFYGKRGVFVATINGQALVIDGEWAGSTKTSVVPLDSLRKLPPPFAVADADGNRVRLLSTGATIHCPFAGPAAELINAAYASRLAEERAEWERQRS